MFGNNVNYKFFDEVFYIFEVVEAFLEKKDLSFYYNDELYNYTHKQISFLKKQRLPEEIPKEEYNFFKIIHLYRDVLKNILWDIEENNKVLLRDYAMDTYNCIKYSLDSLIGIEEKDGLIPDVSFLLNDMYNIVTGKTKQKYFEGLKVDWLNMVAQ